MPCLICGKSIRSPPIRSLLANAVSTAELYAQCSIRRVNELKSPERPASIDQGKIAGIPE